MDYEDIEKLWRPAAKALCSDGENHHTFTASCRLAEFLNLPYPEYCYHDMIMLDDILRRKLELLASPHGKTLLKAMEIRRGLV